MEDQEHFMRNLGMALADRGMAPPFLKAISSVYFGRSTQLGMVRQWVDGDTLQHLIVENAASNSEEASKAEG